MRERVEIPPVHLVIRSHPPAPARVGVVRKGAAGRFVGAVLSIVVFWGACRWLVWVPPHYPWPVLSLCLGAYLAHRSWFGRYAVRWFAGACPACGRALRLAPGARVDLPCTLTCFACHHESRLETFTPDGEERIAADRRGIRHVLQDCAGTWVEESRWDEPFVTCTACGARHHTTPAVQAAARAENERGRLLDRLAEEGRFMVD